MPELYTSCQRCDAAIVLVVEGRVPDRILCERCRLAEDNVNVEIDNIKVLILTRAIMARCRTYGGPAA